MYSELAQEIFLQFDHKDSGVSVLVHIHVRC